MFANHFHVTWKEASCVVDHALLLKVLLAEAVSIKRHHNKMELFGLWREVT